MKELSHVKSYDDTYLYNQYPKYQKILFEAMLKEPRIDKNTQVFEDMVYNLKRSRLLSESLVRILNSTNTILLACNKPMPRPFKVFCSVDIKDRNKEKKNKIFIDCSSAIKKNPKNAEYDVNDLILISHLMQGAIMMVYHQAPMEMYKKADMMMSAATCFTKLFTHIIDYLVKVSIQESSKMKVMYTAAMYFFNNISSPLTEQSHATSTLAPRKIAGVSEREANMIDYLMEKAASSMSKTKADPYEDISIFIRCMNSALHLNDNVITTDIIVEKWMSQYGPGTVFALEYFPALSGMLTDAYNGGYINNQKMIEKICGADMVGYSKYVIDLIQHLV